MLFRSISLLSCILSFSSLTAQSPLPLTLSPRSIDPGPAIAQNFADPSIVNVDGVWYAFATNTRGENVTDIQTASSTDFQTWTVSEADAMPELGDWAVAGRTWAPDVIQMPDGTFRMYYSADTASDSTTHCIGAASAPTVQGPYTPEANPLACPISQGGAIDASAYRDSSGTLYLVYKVDGNNIGHGGSCGNTVAPIVPTPILLQELSLDGLTTVSSPIQLLDRDDDDGPLIEAPSLVEVNGVYVLFFSSGCYAEGTYDVSYATSVSGVEGPYEKATEPLLVTGSGNGLGGEFYSPGGLDVDGNGETVVWHADLGTSSEVRQMWTGKISVEGRLVTI